MRSRKSSVMRTVDVARHAGYSVQQVRNLERDGVLPPAVRMRAAHGYPASDLLALLDAAHARLDTERRELKLAKEAAEAIAAEPIEDIRPSDSMGISELAVALGVRPSTLRHWGAEGLIVPGRASTRGTRRYSPDDVRDARIVHQLRMAGYRIAPLRALMPELCRAHRWDEVMTTAAAPQA